MDKEQGIRIIKDVFEHPFDYDKYVSFSSNLLKHITLTPTTIQAGSRIPDAFKSYIRLMKRVGKYKGPEGNTIDVLAVWLNKGTSLERARTMQRNYIARYLDGSRGGQQKNAALTAFISPDENDWRFSFIKMEYELGRTPTGRLKGVETFTPAKRYSFIVGSNESSHTAQSQLLDILCKDADPVMSEIENAFSIEKVTKEFFKRYQELFGKLKKSLEDIASTDEKTRENFAAQGVNIDDFAKKTLGQIVFLYFLQKKGWFGVKKDEKWGTGHKNFLRKLFTKEIVGYSNFFNDVLEPLFYNTLALKREHDYADKFDCKIPFLNGGLFDPINDYDWVHTDIIIPNEIFSNSFKTKEGDLGTGILDVFDRYNFTVKEDEPLEKDVAVDPEMLGKVFENLLESKERKSKGSFYTPREIVHYMCQESLINYLVNELSDTVQREDIELLVRHGNSIIENEYAVLAKEKKIDTGEQKGTKIKTKIPQSIRDNAKTLDKALEKIRVCDPAVGSGAFLVGMMNEIVKTRRALAPVFEKILLGQRIQERVELVYKLKRHVIQNCLYGVDIDPGAVEIAKLRLWLSLVVDEEQYKTIQPLPNLNYKIMQGNSLLEEYEGVKLFDERMIEPAYNLQEQRRQLVNKQNNLQKEHRNLYVQGKLSGVPKAELESELKTVAQALKKIDKSSVSASDDADLFDYLNQARKKAEELRSLHKDFFKAYQRDEKKELKEKIETIEWELMEATLKEQNKTKELDKLKKFMKSNIKPYFLWKLNFEEVFREKGGFDIVIANPPYVRQEGIKEQKAFLEKAMYEVYNSTSDIYTYFYEQSWRMLRPHGFLTFISSNKWMRAKYGQKLREFIRNKTKIIGIIDFGGHKVFETAAVDTNILIFQKTQAEDGYRLPFVNVDSDYTAEEIDLYIEKRNITVAQQELSDVGWTLADKNILALKRKIEQFGTPLKDWDVKINRGLITGFNKAFIIDNKTKEKLCAEEANSKEVLRPLLRGRDVDRYSYKWQGLWLIKIESGWTDKNRGVEKPEKYFSKEYPAVYKHLQYIGENIKGKGKGLFKRDDQGRYWWELRDCIYYSDFEKEKIIYADIAQRLTFTLDMNKYYLANTVYFMNCNERNKYITGILNSRLFDYYYRYISSQMGAKGIRHFSIYIERLPIVKITDENKQIAIKIETLVNNILDITKDKDYSDNSAKPAKSKEYEQQIDQMVYKLYNLNEEEIKIVNNF